MGQLNTDIISAFRLCNSLEFQQGYFDFILMRTPCSKIIGFFAVSKDGILFQCINIKCCMMRSFASIGENIYSGKCMIHRQAWENIHNY